ncbi:hypothetical protein BDW62DRAFT_34357 [Aspergillus aurantiobrunneus]
MFVTRTFKVSLQVSQSRRKVGATTPDSRTGNMPGLPGQNAGGSSLDRGIRALDTAIWGSVCGYWDIYTRQEKRKAEWRKCVQHEFEFRRESLDKSDGHKIHHFNRAGKSVPRPSNTEPEVSLFITMNLPKVPTPGSSMEFWIKAVHRNAMLFVDPVLIKLKKGADIPRYPEGMLRYARGRTFKFYSSHGSWSSNAPDEKFEKDDGDADFYLDTEVGIGNGFIEGTAVDSWYKWNHTKRTLQHSIRPGKRKRNRVLPKTIEKMHPPCKPSLLKHCISTDKL